VVENNIDVKKIMTSIKKKARESESDITEDNSQTSIKSVLQKRVRERKKPSYYEKNKKFLYYKYHKIDTNFSKNELEHNLYRVNTSTDIDSHQPIRSGRNRIIRWLALKIRHIIQDEIRFTLDPIIRNQTQHNSFSVKILNQINEFLKYFEKKQAEQEILINKHSKDLSKLTNPDLSWKYLDFENRFRGTEDDIKNRQLNYLNYIKNAAKNNQAEFVLEVGCGRGEFLKILDENNIPVKGIDTNTEMIELNLKNNRNVKLDDAISFLQAQNDNSLIGITSFQVIEHFSPDYLLDFIKLSYQKTASGGVIILETVNPMSLFSLTHFWYDITHKTPIPPDVLKFYIESAGFQEVKPIFTSEVPEELKLQSNDENTKKLNQILFGPQDYAIIGWKK